MKTNFIPPKISIVTTAYNSEEYLAESIESVLNQTYENWELIIINDGSNDKTESIIRKFQQKDRRVYYYNNQENIGLIASLNRGIKLSKGEYIARLDSDDIWINTDKLKKQIEFMIQHPDTLLVGTWGYRIDNSGRKLGRLQYPTTDKSIRDYLLIENCFIHSSVIYKKNAVLKSGLYDSRYQSSEDYALWLKLGTQGKLANIPEIMVGYRVNEKGISLTKYNEQITNTIRAILEYKKEYPHGFLALPLWYLRKIIPRIIREDLSATFRVIVHRVRRASF